MSTLPEKTPVVIIGAGPTGLTMAVQLLRYGIDFILLEKKERASQFSKAIAVQARSLEIFDEIGLAQKAITEGKITTAARVFENGKEKIHFNLKGLGKGQSPFTYVLSLSQDKNEKLLIDYLQEHQKKIRWDSSFIGFKEENNHVLVSYEDANKHLHYIETSYLVGADGSSSPVREKMGLQFKGDTVPKFFYVADVKLKSPIIYESKLYMFLIKKGFVIFIPLKGNDSYRIVGILPDADSQPEDIGFTEIQPTLEKHVGVPLQIEKNTWFSTYRVHTRKTETFNKGLVFLAGDAAHIHTPAGGQGMNTGIQDAYNLAWKMAGVLNGNLKGKVLKTYTTEREENAAHLLKTTDRIFDMMAGTNWFWNFLRLKFFPVVAGYVFQHKWLNKFIFPFLSQTAIRYSKNILTISGSIGKAKAGVRMPYFVFKDGTSIFQYLNVASFKLLFFGNNECAHFDLLKSKNLLISTQVIPEIPTAIFGNHTNFYVFLRPDNHIAYLGSDIKRCNKIIAVIIT